MATTVTDRPTDAEAIRTACMRVTAAMVAIEGAEPSPVTMVHLFDGQAFVLIGSDTDAMAATRAGSDGVPAMIEVTDCAPIELRERVRSLIWLNGVLHRVPADLERDLALEIALEHPADELLDLGHGYSMLRLQLTGAVIATSTGAAAVAADELTRATPDPFWQYEADWIAHLDSDHSDVIEQLGRRLPAHLRTGRVRPLGIDRWGIRFRVEGETGDLDTRLSFDRPVTDVMALSRALRALAGCPYLNSITD
ncbi:DUF2470 domain-containing protein [Williamsia sp. M5A3_1d]